MNKDISCITDDRLLDRVAEDLRKTDGAYALAAEICSELREKLDPVITSEKELTLDGCDFTDIREYIENESTVAEIEKRALYRQGYRDCVELLRGLGVLR